MCCLPSWGLSSASLPWPMLQTLYIYLGHLHTLRSGEETYIISVILQINWDTGQVWHTGGAETENIHLTLARRTLWALSCPHCPLSPNSKPRRNQSCQHIDLGLLASRTMRKYTSVFKPSVVANLADHNSAPGG